MNGIKTLVKMHRRDLDALRRALVSFESQKEQLMQLSAQIQHELKEEWKLAEDTPQMGAYLAEFSKRIQKRQVEITKEIIALDGKISELLMHIAQTFGEVKKYEIVDARMRERKTAIENAKEQLMLDEVGLQQYVKKEE